MKKAAGLPAVPALSDVSPDHICTIIYTSGTTGNPKGVELSHRNIVSVCRGSNSLVSDARLSEQMTSLAFLPWAHVYGMSCELHQLSANGTLFFFSSSFSSFCLLLSLFLCVSVCV
jgi:long-chain acyl-CoA synthetase